MSVAVLLSKPEDLGLLRAAIRALMHKTRIDCRRRQASTRPDAALCRAGDCEHERILDDLARVYEECSR